MAVGDLIVIRGPKPKLRFVPGPNYRKFCNACHKRRLAKFFHKRAASPDGLAFTCKDCVSTYGKGRDWKEDTARRRERRQGDREIVPGTRAYSCWLAREHPEIAAANKIAHRRRRRLAQYGITPKDYESMLNSQGGLCAICGNPETKIGRNGEVQQLSVDHNHRTGRVRELICHMCNVAVGVVDENPAIALAVAEYLQKWGE